MHDAPAAPPVPHDEAARLALLRECRILDTLDEAGFDDLTRLAAQICGVPIALISLIDESRQWFKSRVGLDATETPRRLAFCAHAIIDPGQMLIVPDATKDARFAANELVTGEMGIRFYAGAPLVLEEGSALGTLCVIDRHPRELSAVQQEALAALARQVVSQITLRRQNFALQQAQAARDQFFNLPLDMLCIAGMDGFFRLLNPAFSEALGYSTEELLASPFLSFVHPDDMPATLREIARLEKGLPTLDFESRCRRKDGTYIWLSWKCTPGPDGALYASARDITPRKRAEEKLLALSALQRGILDSAAHSVIATTPEGVITEFNPASEHMLGYAAEEMIGRATPKIFHVLDEVVQHAKEVSEELGVVLEPGFASLTAKTRRGLPNDYEWTFVRKDGGHFPALLSITALRDAAHNITGFLGLFLDITERKRAEARLKASLVEKEALLQEIHHRVKNNLQVVSSLLSLESGYIEDPATLARFQECQGRIRSMALIHEKLYQSETLARVDLSDYLDSLLRMIVRSYAAHGGVRLALKLSPLETNIDTAVPLGLLVNELMTNALKYAFPQGGGTIEVSLEADEESHFAIAVQDDGAGLPQGFAIGSAKTLGMKLVAIFVKQLRGELTVSSVPGRTVFRIRIPRAAGTGS